MTPDFAKAVDNVFLCVLDLLSRIETNEAQVVADERIRIRGTLDQAEALLGQRPEWELSKYAMVAWIDEVLIEAEWPGRRWWVDNVLEVEFFQSREANSTFYVRAIEAGKLPNKNALEVFYVCVMLGFRGLYRDPAGAATAQRLGMPPDLETWVKKTALAIQLGQGRPPIAEAPREGRGAPPLDGKFQLVGMMLVFIVILSMTTILGWWVFYLSRGQPAP